MSHSEQYEYDIDKAYVSPYDRFLYEFDACHEKSASQLKEINKYRRIFALRDHAQSIDESNEMLKDF